MSGANGFFDGLGTSALFNAPRGVAIDPTNTFAIVGDYNNNRLRKVMLANGATTTFIGNGAATSVDGLGTAATLRTPYGLAIDPAGTAYATDNQGQRIRKVSQSGITTTTAVQFQS